MLGMTTAQKSILRKLDVSWRQERKQLKSVKGFHLLEESEFVGGKTLSSSHHLSSDKKSQKANARTWFARLLNNNEPQYPEGLALHPEAWNFSTHLFRETLIFSDDERKTNPPLKENAKNQSCVKDVTVTIQNRESEILQVQWFPLNLAPNWYFHFSIHIYDKLVRTNP